MNLTKLPNKRNSAPPIHPLYLYNIFVLENCEHNTFYMYLVNNFFNLITNYCLAL